MDEHLVAPGSNIKLQDVDPEYTGAYADKDAAEPELSRNSKAMVDLQELLYAESKRALLIVLQAMDTGGKDGTIRHVMCGVSPQGVAVTSFKVPSALELAHDFLWRIHAAVPPRGMIGIFNRSHYEDVLVVRVHELVPERVWRARYEQINAFERHLTQNGITVLKFYLHISKDEQKRRLEERRDDPTKRWKFALGDLNERLLWDKYMRAYEDAINATSTEWAPWRVIPANHKWYRNLCIGRTVAETLRGFDMKYPDGEAGAQQVKIPD